MSVLLETSGCLLGDGCARTETAKQPAIAPRKKILDLTISTLAAANDCESGICARLIERKNDYFAPYKSLMKHPRFLLVALGLVSSIALAYEVPSIAPKPLKETQDLTQVQAHADAAKRNTPADLSPVVPDDWIKQIQDLAVKNSHRESMPVEHCTFIFKKDGTLAKIDMVIPTNATRTPNTAYQNHNVCSVEFDAKKGGKLKLSDEKKVEGPDLREIFGINQLPLICQELISLRKFQQAFATNGLKYTLEADVILAPDEKSWVWQVAPSEEQRPNVIYAMYYYPITGELRSTSIDNAKVKQKVEAAAKTAGFHIIWVKTMDDR